MAWRVWSKLCCGHKWLLLLSPLFLLFLTIFIMTITLPLPVPHPDADRWPSRALSSARDFKTRRRIVEPPPATAIHQPLSLILPSVHGRTWKSNNGEEWTENSMPAAPNDKNRLKLSSRVDKNKHRSRKETADTVRQLTSHHSPHIPLFTVSSKTPKPRIKPCNHSAETYISLERSKSAAGHVPSAADTVMTRAKINDSPRSTKHRPATKESRKSNSVTKQTKNMKKDRNQARIKKNSSHCLSFPQQDFPESDRRSVRVGPDLRTVPWFSEDDVQKMKLLAEGDTVSKARVPAHGQVLQVALEPPSQQQTSPKSPEERPPQSHSERCVLGQCSLVKRTDDWFEVFAFHLDRVLGLNRSLPTVLRSFHSEILPYRFIRGAPRPVVWWDPDIQHLDDNDNDQNSVPLSYVQYQRLLKARCGKETGLKEAPCVGVHHSEWGKLALFDFLLQVNDRLDRYCCGFKPDPTDLCVENMLHSKCGNIKNLLLVHILVRKVDPSRLVFIDNAGRPLHPADNLNFRLVQGIEEFPEKAVSVLQSGCLEALLLRSLYTNREFWDSRGGADGLRPLIRTVEQRGQILLQHIRDKKLPLKRDL